MITEVRKPQTSDLFNEEIIEVALKMNGIHTDGITCIELIEENDAFLCHCSPNIFPPLIFMPLFSTCCS